MFGLLSWGIGRASPRAQVQSEAIIARQVRRISFPSMLNEPGLWLVAAEPADTYRVSLHLWAVDHEIHCMATSEISVERDFIPRELLLNLLEENHRFEAGSFRLVPREDRRMLTLGRVINTLAFPESDLVPLGETLIERMQRMINKLFAMGLIVTGPHETAERDRKRGNRNPS